jgi:hypothetical protein
MAEALDRNTGLPFKGTNPYQDQSYAQGVIQSAAPRTDTGTSTVVDRTNQSVSSYQSGINTTPQIIDALHSLIADLQGTAAKGPVTAKDAEMAVPLLVREVIPGFGPTQFSPGVKSSYYYRDPKTGATFSAAQGDAENTNRLAQREQMVTKEITPATQAGTTEQQKQVQERQTEIARNRVAQEIIRSDTGTQAAKYSKEAAFADAQALVNKSISDALEKAMPQITAASEGAGTSKGSMRALLTQRAAERGAVEGAALGVQAAGVYGGVANQAAGQGIQGQNQLAGVLELLTRSDPNNPATLLLQAIIGSKGLVTQQSGSQDTSGTSVKQQDTTSNVGAQQTLTDTLKQILAPLNALNSYGAVPAAEQVRAQAEPAASYSSGSIQNTTSLIDENYQNFVTTPSSEGVYLSSSEEVA